MFYCLEMGTGTVLKLWGVILLFAAANLWLWKKEREARR
jgi:hypothetical protein